MTIILIILALLAPAWVYGPLLIAAAILVPFYWEGLVIGAIIDALYGVWPMLYFTFMLTIILVAAEPLKERLRLHA